MIIFLSFFGTLSLLSLKAKQIKKNLTNNSIEFVIFLMPSVIFISYIINILRLKGSFYLIHKEIIFSYFYLFLIMLLIFSVKNINNFRNSNIISIFINLLSIFLTLNLLSNDIENTIHSHKYIAHIMFGAIYLIYINISFYIIKRNSLIFLYKIILILVISLLMSSNIKKNIYYYGDKMQNIIFIEIILKSFLGVFLALLLNNIKKNKLSISISVILPFLMLIIFIATKLLLFIF